MAISGIPSINPEPLKLSLSEAPVVEQSSVSPVDLKSSLTAREYVERYFSDIPVLVEVARCESQFRHYDKNGKILTGEVNEYDLGVMQINELYHEERSDRLGLNLYTIEGNTAYARYLFEKEGLRPWKSSSPCWKKSQAYSDHVEIELASK